MADLAGTKKLDEGKQDSHTQADIKDERSLVNKYNAEKKHEKEEAAEENAKPKPPTAAALEHGNEPSRGAKIDEKIMDEEEELVKKMDEAKAQKKANK